jgi:hypothetical protein
MPQTTAMWSEFSRSEVAFPMYALIFMGMVRAHMIFVVTVGLLLDNGTHHKQKKAS